MNFLGEKRQSSSLNVMLTDVYFLSKLAFNGPVWHHKGKIYSTAFFSALILKTGASKGAKVSRKFTDRLEAQSVSAWKSVTETEFLQLIGTDKKIFRPLHEAKKIINACKHTKIRFPSAVQVCICGIGILFEAEKTS